VSGKRGGKVERPTASDEWVLKFGAREAAKAWTELGNAKLANALARLYDVLVKDPRWRGNPDRHHQLKGELATGTYDGRKMERWQHEISGSGRVWFLVDDAHKTVWIVHVSAGHPSATD
jgi:hypothetical protein